MKHQKLMHLFAGTLITTCLAITAPLANTNNPDLPLQNQSGFFRYSFDNVQMPQHIPSMGLFGLNYLANFTPTLYGGVGAYGAMTGTQGGLFTLGLSGGLHHELFPNWFGDAGLFVGGGGGRSSLVGGGLMLRPHIGLAYQWQGIRLGVHYSYINFPDGEIRSHQIGLDLDIPTDFYSVPFQESGSALFKLDNILTPPGKYLNFQRNDFALTLSAYRQRTGTKNLLGETQDGTIKLVGAELDHYLTDHTFWWLKADGAFSGVPNGFMDVLAGLGYHWSLGSSGLALVPELGAGAGGGGNVDTGGGILLQPEIGIEWPLTSRFSARLNGGYIWSPKGQLNTLTASGLLIYHLDIGTSGNQPSHLALTDYFKVQNWRIELFNQTYIHPQRGLSTIQSSANLVVVQLDQLFTPHFFFSYQAASAYSGNHTGGLATGMIGPGIQSPLFFHQQVRLFAEVLVGAGGGGGLALGGGSLVEPVIGLHYALTPSIGIQTSIAELKAIQDNLNTPVFNLGVTIRFGLLERT